MKVRSAGTHALIGERPTPETLALLEGKGIPYNDTAVKLTRRLIGPSQLVLTATRRHRVDVTRVLGAAADRTFTILELARLLRDAGSPVGLGLETTLNLVQRMVAMGDERDHDDDLADPHGRPADDFALMAQRAEDALREIVLALRVES